MIDWTGLIIVGSLLGTMIIGLIVLGKSLLAKKEGSSRLELQNEEKNDSSIDLNKRT